MASKIIVDQLESSGSNITIPTGTGLVVTDGIAATNLSGTIADARLPTVPVTKGGTGLTSLGSAGQVVQVNSGGNALEFAAASSGKLKQIVNGYWENGGSEWTTTSQSFVDTPLTFNITPTASTSKILVSFVTNGSRSNSTSNNAIFTIKRAISGGATTDLGSGSTYALAHTYSPNPSIQTLQKVDAPNTTSQITYTVQAKSDGGTADLARRSSQSTYYAIEIGA